MGSAELAKELLNTFAVHISGSVPAYEIISEQVAASGQPTRTTESLLTMLLA